MAAVITQNLDQGSKVQLAPRLIGNGAIANGDVLATDVSSYPVGTEYFDITNKKIYKRIAIAGVAADFVATAALA